MENDKVLFELPGVAIYESVWERIHDEFQKLTIDRDGIVRVWRADEFPVAHIHYTNLAESGEIEKSFVWCGNIGLNYANACTIAHRGEVAFKLPCEVSSWERCIFIRPDKLTINSLVRLGPWHGRIVDFLMSETTGERFARVKLLKHFTEGTEVHPVDAFKRVTVADAQIELQALEQRLSKAKELIGVD